MPPFLCRRLTGLSVVEVLVAIFIFATLTLVVTGLALLGTRNAAANKQRAAVLAIAHEEGEKIKLISYNQVGYIMSPQSGALPHRKIVMGRDKQIYGVSYDISDVNSGSLSQVIAKQISISVRPWFKREGVPVPEAQSAVIVGPQAEGCQACQTDSDCPIPFTLCDDEDDCPDALQCANGFCQYPAAISPAPTSLECGSGNPCPFGYQCENGNCATQNCLANGPLVCVFPASGLCYDYSKYDSGVTNFALDCEENNWCISEEGIYSCDEAEHQLEPGIAYESVTCDDLTETYNLSLEKVSDRWPQALPIRQMQCSVAKPDVCTSGLYSESSVMPVCCSGTCQESCP